MTTQPLEAEAPALKPGLPDPHLWAAHIAQAVLDTLFGTRPAHQLARWTDPAVYSAILASTPANPIPSGAPRPAVRGVRVSMPTADVAEASVLLQLGHRYRAAAIRLEGAGHRWLCTVFELL